MQMNCRFNKRATLLLRKPLALPPHRHEVTGEDMCPKMPRRKLTLYFKQLLKDGDEFLTCNVNLLRVERKRRSADY